VKSSSVWLAAIAFLGVLALGYSALSLANQLKHNAVLLADRQSELAARILTTAITREARRSSAIASGPADEPGGITAVTAARIPAPG